MNEDECLKGFLVLATTSLTDILMVGGMGLLLGFAGWVCGRSHEREMQRRKEDETRT